MEKYTALQWKTHTSRISEYCRDSRSIASFDTYGANVRRTVSHTFGVSIAFLAYLPIHRCISRTDECHFDDITIGNCDCSSIANIRHVASFRNARWLVVIVLRYISSTAIPEYESKVLYEGLNFPVDPERCSCRHEGWRTTTQRGHIDHAVSEFCVLCVYILFTLMIRNRVYFRFVKSAEKNIK